MSDISISILKGEGEVHVRSSLHPSRLLIFVQKYFLKTNTRLNKIFFNINIFVKPLKLDFVLNSMWVLRKLHNSNVFYVLKSSLYSSCTCFIFCQTRSSAFYSNVGGWFEKLLTRTRTSLLPFRFDISAHISIYNRWFRRRHFTIDRCQRMVQELLRRMC